MSKYLTTTLDNLTSFTANPLLTTLLIATIIYLTLYSLQLRQSHPNEPPIIPPRIPYVGHLLGMALQGGRYVKSIGILHKDKPIFTLPVPKSRIYIVTDPVLAAAVQRASKTLSFTPLVPDLTKRVLGLDEETVHMVRQNLDPEPGEKRGFLADMHDMVYASLGPGEELERLSFAAARELAGGVNEYLKTETEVGGGGGEVNLLHWVRHFVTIATAKFLYGEENPISSDASLEEAFWDFDQGLGGLLMGVFPAVTARKPYEGRERLAVALGEYLEDGRWRRASLIVRKRVEIGLRHGWTLKEMSRSEISFLFAGIVNTATTTFWVVLQVFAGGKGGLVDVVRGELRGAVVEEDGGRRVLSLEKVKNGAACPTLMAVLRECLRVGSDNYSTRLVKADTMLAGRWFLKKDCVVQIAGGVIHADERIWGCDAGVFNHGRFLGVKTKSEENGNGNGHSNGGGNSTNVHPAAFRAFGGGKTLCPGRHFATNEILAFVAMIVLTFDIERVDGGQIRVPEKDDGVLPVHILEPKEDVKVRVVVRDGRRIDVV